MWYFITYCNLELGHMSLHILDIIGSSNNVSVPRYQLNQYIVNYTLMKIFISHHQWNFNIYSDFHPWKLHYKLITAKFSIIGSGPQINILKSLYIFYLLYHLIDTPATMVILVYILVLWVDTGHYSNHSRLGSLLQISPTMLRRVWLC